jgi:exodeoxyribonuclease V alpha subunit
MPDSETLTGTLARVQFRNDETEYSVLRVMPEGDYDDAVASDGTIVVVGNLPALDKGVRVTFTGGWIEHNKFGRQFQAEEVKLHQESFPDAPAGSEEETLIGTIERITFYNEDNGWGVIRIAPEGKYPAAAALDGTITVVGVMPALVEGEMARFTGKWVNNPQYGMQLRAITVIPLAPQSQEGIVHYIADTVFGIGKRTAQRIYDHFGEKTMEILDTTPEKVYDVPGLKPKLAENLIAQWSQNRAQRQIMIHLQGYGITSRLAKKIYDEYGSETLVMVQSDPYQLADDVYGIGFKKADAIAQGMGIAVDSRVRLRAGLIYALSQMSYDGHTFAPRHKLLDTAAELLGVADKVLLTEELQTQLLGGRVIADTLPIDKIPVEAIYLPMFYHSELRAAERLKKIAYTTSELQKQMKGTAWKKYLLELSEQNDVTLSDQQQSAVKAALLEKVSVLTGGPGTGKTTTLQMVINALEKENITYELASPTGRAAKRLGEATGRQAQTIHRLLGFSWEAGGFEHDEDNPLKADFLIVDETSMLDLLLFHSLLKAIKPNAHVMLVGDVDQLPSVGAGNVLNDVIHSGVAHVTRLTQIFRQANHSHIVTNAHRINQGDMPYMENQSDDFFFFTITDPAEAGRMIVDIVMNRLEKKISEYDRMNDVQVIAPMYRGPIGVNALNQALQEKLNPANYRVAEKRLNGILFRVGDKVMQTRNNYEKEVFNGDIGRIRAFDFEENAMEVIIDERIITYDFSETEELIHAYCISTHRSQGSEYPIVVMPLMTQHYMMLQRNLLYTAITRAKKMVVLVGDKKAVFIAVNNNKVAERYSGLLTRLQG